MVNASVCIRGKTVEIMPNGEAYVNGRLLATSGNGYIRNVVAGKPVYRHRMVYAAFNPSFDIDSPFIVDHIDRDPTNNSISNLRLADRCQNAQNSRRRFGNGGSQYKNIRAVRVKGGWGWRIDIRSNGKMHTRFYRMGEGDRPAGSTVPDYVVKQRDEMLKRLHGEFACYC